MRVRLVVLAVLLTAACGGGEEADVTSTPDAATDTSSTTTSGAPRPDLPVELSLSSPGGTIDALPVTVTLTNVSDEAVVVLEPFFAGNIVSFRVEGPDGDPVPFDGPYARLEPLDDDLFVPLAPGASVASDFDLADHFTLRPGTHRVTAEYRNPPGGLHEGERGLVFAPGEGPLADPIEVDVR